MIRSIFILALVSTLAVGCSQPAPQQAAGGGTDASAPPTASQPGAQSAPATTPAAAADQSGRPANAEASPPAATAARTPTPAAAPAPPPEPPAPKFREVTIPTGTSLSVTLATPLASDTSMPEDRVKGALAKSIVISGTTVVPQGADLSGSVIEANGSKRVKGKASIVFQFDHLMVRGENHRDCRLAREAGGRGEHETGCQEGSARRRRRRGRWRHSRRWERRSDWRGGRRRWHRDGDEG